ncbi:hypothetical protein D3C76_1518140 [compost metagenome]
MLDYFTEQDNIERFRIKGESVLFNIEMRICEIDVSLGRQRPKLTHVHSLLRDTLRDLVPKVIAKTPVDRRELLQ